MSKSEKTYKQLKEIGYKAALFQSMLYHQEWDQETYMPAEGLKLCAEKKKLLSELKHKQKVNAKVKRLLESVCNLETGEIKATDLDERKQASIKQMRRDYLLAAKIKPSFVKKFADVTTNALDAWKKARANNSFKEFAPHLKKVFDLCRKKAEMIGYEDHPYDAMLEEFEPGMTVKQLDTLFDQLKERLIFILYKRKEMNINTDTSHFEGQFFSIAHQKELSKNVIEQMGLGTKNYNLSETVHPFCLPLSSKDIRLTTHFHGNDFRKAYFASIHEAGHGLYESGLPEEDFGTPLAEAASFGIHESQSRFYECFIGHSKPFWKNQYPKIKEAFPDMFDTVPLDRFVESINTVNPSLIRIFADEVTYSLHIILRYEIEKGMMDGSIQVKDIPKIWNQKMNDYLGITPKNDAEGCLQDIHWSIGAIGYFPSYALGNLFAGALYVNMIKKHTSWEQKVAEGDLLFIKQYLYDNVHKYGRQYEAVKLIEKATGEPFTAKPYLAYLEGKFL